MKKSLDKLPPSFSSNWREGWGLRWRASEKLRSWKKSLSNPHNAFKNLISLTRIHFWISVAFFTPPQQTRRLAARSVASPAWNSSPENVEKEGSAKMEKNVNWEVKRVNISRIPEQKKWQTLFKNWLLSQKSEKPISDRIFSNLQAFSNLYKTFCKKLLRISMFFKEELLKWLKQTTPDFSIGIYRFFSICICI